jgi:hypothetical protein
MKLFKRKRNYPSRLYNHKKPIDPWTVIIAIFVFTMFFFIIALIALKIYPYLCNSYLR